MPCARHGIEYQLIPIVQTMTPHRPVIAGLAFVFGISSFIVFASRERYDVESRAFPSHAKPTDTRFA